MTTKNGHEIQLGDIWLFTSDNGKVNRFLIINLYRGKGFDLALVYSFTLKEKMYRHFCEGHKQYELVSRMDA